MIDRSDGLPTDPLRAKRQHNYLVEKLSFLFLAHSPREAHTEGENI